jgi:O-antigen ligase
VVKRPWLGYGYAAFWSHDEGYSALIQALVRWKAPNAHNGFLDQTLVLGVIGLVFFLVIYGDTLWRAAKLFYSSQTTSNVWPLFFVLFLFFYNLDETNMVQHNSYMWALFIAVRVGLKTDRNLLKSSSRPATVRRINTHRDAAGLQPRVAKLDQ